MIHIDKILSKRNMSVPKNHPVVLAIYFLATNLCNGPLHPL